MLPGLGIKDVYTLCNSIQHWTYHSSLLQLHPGKKKLKKHFIAKMKLLCSLVAILVISCCYLASAQRSGSGKCSWYGAEGEIPEGHPTYCGEFHRFSMDTAHFNVPNMPCGTRLRVRNDETGQTVEVRVNDKGPNGRPGYILDLTYAAFGQIADRDKGIINCSYEVI